MSGCFLRLQAAKRRFVQGIPAETDVGFGKTAADVGEEVVTPVTMLVQHLVFTFHFNLPPVISQMEEPGSS